MSETLVSGLHKLDSLLNRGMYEGVSFRMECCNAFEPHGRASETWETFWLLTIPDIPYYWRTASATWQKGSEKAGAQSFKGRLPNDVIAQAVRFLEESGIRQTLTGKH